MTALVMCRKLRLCYLRLVNGRRSKIELTHFANMQQLLKLNLKKGFDRTEFLKPFQEFRPALCPFLL